MPTSNKQRLDRVAKDIYWVGAYMPEMQTSINAFLLIDEKRVLIDTGAVPTALTVVENISKYIDPATLDYVVLTHSCVDHAGGLSALIDVIGDAKVVGHPYTEHMLDMYGYDVPFLPAFEGSKFSLGEKTLWFLPPMFQDTWDTMYVFEESERVLFSADTFCNGPREWSLFTSQDIRPEILTYHNVKFPSTSLGDHKKLRVAANTLKQLDARVIASGHGHLIDRDIDAYIDTMAEIL